MSIGCVGKLGHLSGFLRHYLLISVLDQFHSKWISKPHHILTVCHGVCGQFKILIQHNKLRHCSLVFSIITGSALNSHSFAWHPYGNKNNLFTFENLFYYIVWKLKNIYCKTLYFPEIKNLRIHQ